MVVTTLGALVNAEAALAELSKQRLAAKDAYKIAKILRLSTVEAKHFHEQRHNLIKELGTERQDDKSRAPVWEVGPDKIAAFIARLNELAEVPVKLDVEPIALDVLGDISAADIVALGALIDTGEQVEKPNAKLRQVKRA